MFKNADIADIADIADSANSDFSMDQASDQSSDHRKFDSISHPVQRPFSRSFSMITFDDQFNDHWLSDHRLNDPQWSSIILNHWASRCLILRGVAKIAADDRWRLKFTTIS